MSEITQQDINKAEQYQELKSDVKYIKEQVTDISLTLKKDYVSKLEFLTLKDEVSLIRSIVFGFVGLILLSFGGALVTFFINTHK